MLVLKEIYKGINKLHHIYMEKDNIDMEVTLTILNTDTGERFVRSYSDISDSVFGILRYRNKVILICVNDIEWKFLDIIDSPKKRYYNNSFHNKLLSLYGEDIKYNKELSKGFAFIYNYKDTIILYTKITMNLDPLDENLIFWVDNQTGIAYSILDVYVSAIGNMILNDKMEIYIDTYGFVVYKLDINKDVIRFLTKYKSLRTNK